MDGSSMAKVIYTGDAALIGGKIEWLFRSGKIPECCEKLILSGVMMADGKCAPLSLMAHSNHLIDVGFVWIPRKFPIQIWEGVFRRCDQCGIVYDVNRDGSVSLCRACREEAGY